jgi:hypothetical protein
MTATKAIVWVLGGALALTMSACASLTPTPEFMRIPRDIRTGAAEMVIERVEQDVSREEVAQALGVMIARAPVCMSWPGLWLEGDDRRNVFFARFDLMARDWGQGIADESERRMQEFVELGFLTKRERPEIGAGAFEYTLTPEGSDFLHGTPYGGDRPSFCAPSQRRLAEIVAIEWGNYDCGGMRVRFTHVADDWPTWARTDGARARVAEAWAPIGAVASGAVTLSRQWFRQNQLPEGVSKNGELRSLCYDSADDRVTGEDLDLRAAPEPALN